MSEQVSPVLEREWLQGVKRTVLTVLAFLPYQNDKELMNLILHCGMMRLSRTLSSHQT